MFIRFEGAVKPANFKKALVSGFGIHDNIWSKSAWIELCVFADECAQVGKSAARPAWI
jgi:hypothetical protein